MGGNFTVNTDLKHVAKVEHTDYFKEVVYENVHNGWLKNPANNLRFSLKIIRKIKKVETSFAFGYTTTFKGGYTQIPPFTGIVGVRYIF